LAQVEVRERLTYDADQLAAFTGSDPDLDVGGSGCCGGARKAGDKVKQALAQLAGKIASAKIFGMKPV
jgi:hypothetical protein